MKTKRTVSSSITSKSFKWNMDPSHNLCFHVLEEWAGNTVFFFPHTAERLANRRKEPKSKISLWIKPRLNFALIRSMLLCLCGTRKPSNVENISEIDLCATVAESNIKWITYRVIPCYFKVINTYSYIFTWSLSRYFLCLYPVIRCLLIFVWLLDLRVVKNIYIFKVQQTDECVDTYVQKKETLQWNLRSFCIKYRFFVVLWSVWKRFQPMSPKYHVVNKQPLSSEIWGLTIEDEQMYVWC